VDFPQTECHTIFSL